MYMDMNIWPARREGSEGSRKKKHRNEVDYDDCVDNGGNGDGMVHA
jgi:hypothetical protein